MSLARAFTKRGKRSYEASSATPESSFKYAAGTIERSKISLPTEFISTTNVHALNAPDICSFSSASSDTSSRSADDMDGSKTFLSTQGSSPATSVESSPISPESNSRKAFFGPKRSATTSTSRSSSGTSSSSNSDGTPALPQRAVSHSKKAHQELSRKRSASRLTPPPTIMSSSPIIRNSADMFGGTSNADSNHPFSHELAQVNEVAEEFGGSGALLDEEDQEMRERGLIRFGAEDYVCEILGLFGGRLDHGRLTSMASPWI